MQTATTNKLTFAVVLFALSATAFTIGDSSPELANKQIGERDSRASGKWDTSSGRGRSILLGLVDKLVDFCELLARQLNDSNDRDNIELLDYCPIGDEEDDTGLMRYLASTKPMPPVGGDATGERQTKKCWHDAIDWLNHQLLAIRTRLMLESNLPDCLLRFGRLARYFEDTCADIGGAGDPLNIQDSWPLNEIRRSLVMLAKLNQQLAADRKNLSEDEIVRRLMKQMAQ